MPGAGYGHRPLLHGLEQRGLRLRGRAVDLVGQQHVREDRPRLELERRPAFDEHRRARHVGRHEVRRELDAREGQVCRLGERLDEARLAKAGNAFDERMPARQRGDEQLLDDLVLPQDDAGYPRQDLAELLLERFTGVAYDRSGVHVSSKYKAWAAGPASRASRLTRMRPAWGRVTLRPLEEFTEQDWRRLQSHFRDPEISYLNGTPPNRMPLWLLKRLLKADAGRHDRATFGIFDERDEFIGTTELYDVRAGSATLGIIIGEKTHWSRG